MTTSSSASGARALSTSVNGLSSPTVPPVPADVGGPNPGSPIGPPSVSLICAKPWIDDSVMVDVVDRLDVADEAVVEPGSEGVAEAGTGRRHWRVGPRVRACATATPVNPPRIVLVEPRLPTVGLSGTRRDLHVSVPIRRTDEQLP
jgi:hypothetical protein